VSEELSQIISGSYSLISKMKECFANGVTKSEKNRNTVLIIKNLLHFLMQKRADN